MQQSELSRTATESFVRSNVCKLPSFDPEDGDIVHWHRACENFFSINFVDADEIKCKIILKCFSKEHLMLLHPYIGGTYRELLEAVYKLFSPTNEQRFWKVIETKYDNLTLPSSFYNKIKLTLNSRCINSEGLRYIFLSSADPIFRNQLAIYDHLPDHEYYDVADKLYLTNRKYFTEKYLKPVGKASKDTSSTTDESVIQQTPFELMGNVTKINQTHSNLKLQSIPYQKSYVKTQKAGCSKRKNTNGLCYFHFKHKNLAKKCCQPCTWTNVMSKFIET